MTQYRFVLWHDALHVAEIVDHGEGTVAMTPGTVTPFTVGNPKLRLLGEIPLACADPTFDMVALARRGLQALLDEADAEVEFARKRAWVDRTGQLTPASVEAQATAAEAFRTASDQLARFAVLHPEAATKPEPAFAGPARWPAYDGRIEPYQP